MRLVYSVIVIRHIKFLTIKVHASTKKYKMLNNGHARKLLCHGSNWVNRKFVSRELIPRHLSPRMMKLEVIVFKKESRGVCVVLILPKAKYKVGWHQIVCLLLWVCYSDLFCLTLLNVEKLHCD